jgi:hypothetical protein
MPHLRLARTEVRLRTRLDQGRIVSPYVDHGRMSAIEGLNSWLCQRVGLL